MDNDSKTRIVAAIDTLSTAGKIPTTIAMSAKTSHVHGIHCTVLSFVDPDVVGADFVRAVELDVTYDDAIEDDKFRIGSTTAVTHTHEA